MEGSRDKRAQGCPRKRDSVGTTSGPAHGKASGLREQDRIGFQATAWGRQRQHSLVSPTGDELSWGGGQEGRGGGGTKHLVTDCGSEEDRNSCWQRAVFSEVHLCDKGSGMGQSMGES